MVVDLCIMPYGMPLIREIHFVHRRVYNYSLREIHFVHCAVLFSRFTTGLVFFQRINEYTQVQKIK